MEWKGKHRTKGLSVPFDVQKALFDVFLNNGWNNSQDLDENAGLFSKFCNLMKLLREEEQHLLLNLTGEFLRCRWAQYEALMEDLVLFIQSRNLSACSEIIILPLVSSTAHYSKSGTSMTYPLANLVSQGFQGRGVHMSVRPLPKLSELDKVARSRRNALLVFIDDFIGSGETALKVVDEFMSNHYVESDRLAICALVAQEQGLRWIRKWLCCLYPSIDCAVHVTRIRRRGISDSQTIYDRKGALSLMDAIEERFKVDSDRRRGYGRCEGLVTMLDTPNNTFPVYWWRPRGKEREWPAPFPRRRPR